MATRRFLCARRGMAVARLAEGLWEDEDEGRIWVDLLVGELQMFAGIKASNDLHPSSPYTPQI